MVTKQKEVLTIVDLCMDVHALIQELNIPCDKREQMFLKLANFTDELHGGALHEGAYPC